MDLVPGAADDDTHDTEQDERDAADDEPMRKLELLHKGYVLHPNRPSPSARSRPGGGWPRAGQEGLIADGANRRFAQLLAEATVRRPGYPFQ
jgi:hypothetical protein